MSFYLQSLKSLPSRQSQDRMISVSQKGRRQILQVVIILALSSVAFINISKIKNSIFVRNNHDIGTKFSEPNYKTFELEHCNCSRTLYNVQEDNSVSFSDTTCGRDAFNRGSHQKVAGFSFYGNTSSSSHKSKKYFAGIEENLRLLRSEYGDGWSMRLYYDLAREDKLTEQLCQLACTNSHLDLCYVRQLPGSGELHVTDASDIFAMTWRFLPPVDPQVELFLCRDLDSRISRREVAAVTEWLQSGRALHSMRDHPAHNTPLLGAAWGANTVQANIRHKWLRAWQKILKDPLSRASRESKGPDQELLTKWVWPWGKFMALEHDSYT